MLLNLLFESEYRRYYQTTRKSLEIKVKNMKCQYDMKTSQKSYKNGEKVKPPSKREFAEGSRCSTFNLLLLLLLDWGLTSL